MAIRPCTPVVDHIRTLVDAAESDRLGDDELLDRFVHAHDQIAFAALVRRYGPMVLGVCRRALHDRHAAEDAFQATFLTLARKASNLGRRGSLAGWLHTVAFHLGCRARAQSRRRALVESAWPPRPQEDPLEELTGRELCIVLDQELQRLPADYRVALLACCVEGRTREEAARQFGWTVGQVKARLERGRVLLRRRLLRRGVTLAVALVAARQSQDGAAAAVPALAGPVCRAAAALAAGTPPTGLGISAQAAGLLQGELASLSLARTKGWLALALAAGLAATGVAVLALGPRQPGNEPPARQAPPASSPQAGPKPRTDLQGDPLPPDAVARMGTTRFRHRDRITSVAYAPDCRSIVATSLREVCVWEATSGRPLNRFRITSSGGCVVSPDQKTVAATTLDGKLQLWDLKAQKPLRSWEVPGVKEQPPNQRFIRHIAYAPDGRGIATAGPDGVIRWWDPATGDEVRQLTAPKACERGFVLAAGGARLAYAHTDRTIRVCRTDTGEEVLQIKATPPGEGVIRGVSALAFRADGKTLVTSVFRLSPTRRRQEHVLQLWNADTGEEVTPPALRGQDLEQIAFAPDGKTVALGDHDGGIRLCDLASGKELRRMRGHGNFGTSALAFSPDGTRLVSGGSDATVRQWDVATGRELHGTVGHQHKIHGAIFSPDGRTLATTSEDKTIRLWDAQTGQERQRIEAGELLGESGLVGQGLLFTPDGKTLIANCWDSTVRFWDVATGKEVRRIQEEKGFAAAVLALSPDGKVLAAGEMTLPTEAGLPSSRLVFWQADTGKKLRVVPTARQLVVRVAFGSGGRTLLGISVNLTGGQLLAHEWDVASGEERRHFDLTAGIPVFLIIGISPDSRRIALQYLAHPGDLVLSVWDVGRAREIRRWTGKLQDRGAVLSQPLGVLAFSPDNRVLAAALEDPLPGGGIHCWEIASGQERRVLTGQDTRTKALTYSPDGTLLASGGNDTVALVWDVAGRLTIGEAPPSAPELAAHWAALRGDDAFRADRAVWALAAHPRQAVPFLREQLKPAVPADPREIARCLTDLDDQRFAVRARAAEKLQGLAELAEPGLRQARAGASAEAARQIDDLLARIGHLSTSPPPARLQMARALEVLEHAATPEAVALVRSLAGGTPEAALTREAKRTLERLNRRAGGNSRP